MPQFALICFDKPNSLALRLEVRPVHRDYLMSKGAQLLLAGPLAGPEGDNGSVLIIEVEDQAAAEAFAAADPYAQAGLFESVRVQPFRAVLGVWS